MGSRADINYPTGERFPRAPAPMAQEFDPNASAREAGFRFGSLPSAWNEPSVTQRFYGSFDPFGRVSSDRGGLSFEDRWFGEDINESPFMRERSPHEFPGFQRFNFNASDEFSAQRRMPEFATDDGYFMRPEDYGNPAHRSNMPNWDQYRGTSGPGEFFGNIGRGMVDFNRSWGNSSFDDRFGFPTESFGQRGIGSDANFPIGRDTLTPRDLEIVDPSTGTFVEYLRRTYPSGDRFTSGIGSDYRFPIQQDTGDSFADRFGTSTRTGFDQMGSHGWEPSFGDSFADRWGTSTRTGFPQMSSHGWEPSFDDFNSRGIGSDWRFPTRESGDSFADRFHFADRSGSDPSDFYPASRGSGTSMVGRVMDAFPSQPGGYGDLRRAPSEMVRPDSGISRMSMSGMTRDQPSGWAAMPGTQTREQSFNPGWNWTSTGNLVPQQSNFGFWTTGW